ncbi:hypothetical protein SDC9_99863 [bioreactor metagenome]|uniref:Phosphate-starvation-inducible E-like protein n=1 Tax=bioreactor metagenome TaxID=1076179 RepID=A0A645AIV3_9ZZZZ
MNQMLNIIRTIEKTIILILIVFLAAMLTVSVIELGVFFFRTVFMNPIEGWYQPEFLMPMFSMILIVLIGIELLETIKAYLKDDSIHVELVILVAIIALARKIIVIDYQEASPGKLFGIAGLLLALAGAYFLIKRAGFQRRPGRTRRK